jgi:hypothetical protein
VERLYSSQDLLRQARRLDERIELLLERAAALRPGHSYRTFEPIEPAHPEGFLHHRWNGKCYPPFIDRRVTAHLSESWDTQPNDVLIVTHQKVGTHLAKKYLVELIRACGDLPERHPMAGGDIGHAAVPWPEVYLSQESEAAWQEFLSATSDRPRLWYTHCALPDLPCRRVHPQTRFVMVVRDPRAVVVSLLIVLAVYVLVGAAVLRAVNSGIELSSSPLHDIARAGAFPGAVPLVTVAATVAAGAALLSLIAGVGRTLFAMAGGGDAPSALSRVGSASTPIAGEIVAALLALTVVMLGGIGSALALSAGSIGLYYAVAHMSGLRMSTTERRPPRWVPITGLAGCLALIAGAVLALA